MQNILILFIEVILVMIITFIFFFLRYIYKYVRENITQQNEIIDRFKNDINILFTKLVDTWEQHTKDNKQNNQELREFVHTNTKNINIIMKKMRKLYTSKKIKNTNNQSQNQ